MCGYAGGHTWVLDRNEGEMGRDKPGLGNMEAGKGTFAVW